MKFSELSIYIIEVNLSLSWTTVTDQNNTMCAMYNAYHKQYVQQSLYTLSEAQDNRGFVGNRQVKECKII